MFLTKKKSSDVTLVIDVGSSSVGASLVSAAKSTTPKILFSARLPLVLQNQINQTHSLAAIVSGLESVMKTVMDTHTVIHGSHIIFSSPWCLAMTKVLKIDHDAPTLITHHSVEQLTKEAERKIISESKSDGEIVERRIIQAKLNGYETSDPYNKKAKTLELTFFVSIVAKDVLESVRRIIEKHFHIRKNQISSFSLVAWSAISSIMPNERDFLMIDLRGEVTDVSLVNDGALLKSLAFPQGKNTLIKAVSDSSGQSATASLSMLNTALHNNSAPTTKADVVKFTSSFRQLWLQAYTQVLQDISAGVAMPPTIFLIADSDVEIFFENILNEIKNIGTVRTLKCLNVRNYLEKSSVLTDQFLALEAIFVTMI